MPGTEAQKKSRFSKFFSGGRIIRSLPFFIFCERGNHRLVGNKDYGETRTSVPLVTCKMG